MTLGLCVGGLFGFCAGYALGVVLTMWARRGDEVEQALRSARRPIRERGER